MICLAAMAKVSKRERRLGGGEQIRGKGCVDVDVDGKSKIITTSKRRKSEIEDTNLN